MRLRLEGERGAVSSWMVEHLAPGDEVELTRPRGVFCLREADAPLLGFSGGSGITPILSLAKSALATTGRRVRLLCADRDRDSIIFGTVLDELAGRYPGRLDVLRHLDSERGLLDAAAVRQFVGADGDADSYVCGPEPFMALVESALSGPGRVFSERFGGAPLPPSATATTGQPEGTVTIVLGGKRVSAPRRPDETLLESARGAPVSPRRSPARPATARPASRSSPPAR